VRRSYVFDADWKREKGELDLITEETARILAQLSSYAAFVLSPVSRAAVLKRLELVQVDPQLVLVVLVVDPGFVRTHLVMTERQLRQEQLALHQRVLETVGSVIFLFQR
jgi:transcriptional regulator of heat shock response